MKPAVRPADIIRKYYAESPQAWEILLIHSRLVCRRALKIARRLTCVEKPDLQFIVEAAMLHDIGVILTDTPSLGCHGQGSYLTHGIKGRVLLEQEGLPRHALVCERHIGVGLKAEEIRDQNLDLPPRDMVPESLEEQIICYADLYYSKSSPDQAVGKTPDRVRKSLLKHGRDKVEIYEAWLSRFEPELI
jgi:uncharacterized protein